MSLDLLFVKGEPDAHKREEAVWGDLSDALSRPVTPEEPTTEYIPTQITAEAFRAHGYDGIVYASRLGDGENVALFDCDSAELVNCGIYSVTRVAYTFDEAYYPYFVPRHYPEIGKGTAAAEQPPSKN